MLLNIRNKLDFFLRNRIRWGKPIPENEPVHGMADVFQGELEEFLESFVGLDQVSFRKNIVVADVGTRTFSSAPVIEKVFRKQGLESEIHGYEIDAYRRFTNLRTRAAYGQYYAKKIRNGFYHAADFRETQVKFDVILMLNPFVTKKTHLAWGLPLNNYAPENLFFHCYNSLRKGTGLFLISSPNQQEFEMALKLSVSSGFTLCEEKQWYPATHSLQRQPRLGALFQIRDAF